MHGFSRRGLLALCLLLLPLGSAVAGERYITVASTTSTENSGLFSHILPIFEGRTGIKVRVVAVGTGQAIKLARNGDADVLFVHHRTSEEKIVAEGYGVKRHDVMYNDFVIVGPRDDPAGVGGLRDAARCLAKLAAARAVFVSRGDDSGTHKKERGLWKSAGVDPKEGSGAWYLETGLGMGAALNVTAARKAHTLADRGTWISFNNKADLAVLVEGDDRLYNPYGVILVSKQRWPHVKAADGQAFIDWLTSPEGQAAIASYKRGGQQLFFPSALTN